MTDKKRVIKWRGWEWREVNLYVGPLPGGSRLALYTYYDGKAQPLAYLAGEHWAEELLDALDCLIDADLEVLPPSGSGDE